MLVLLRSQENVLSEALGLVAEGVREASKRRCELLLRTAGNGARWHRRGVLRAGLSQEDGSGRFSSFAVSPLQLCAVNGLWISASWVGAGATPGYSHLGTREVKRWNLVYREGKNVAWGLAISFVSRALC